MEITLHEGQSEVIQDLFVDHNCRYAVVNASRGFGKSFLAATAAMLAVQELMELPADVPNKNVAVIAGNKRQGVATLDRDAAKLKKEELILLGEGESERKRLVLAADGALEQKLKAVVQMNQDAMIALAKRPVPQNYFAGGGTNGSTGASGYDEEMVRVLKLMNMQLVKGLNLDMTVKGQNQ